MKHKVLKYILDIDSVIQEIEDIKIRVENNFNLFNNDVMIKRATERDLEIIGEAVKKLLELEPDLKIENSTKIIGLRNIIIHAYDAVDVALIWSIIQKNIPALKTELEIIRQRYN